MILVSSVGGCDLGEHHEASGDRQAAMGAAADVGGGDDRTFVVGDVVQIKTWGDCRPQLKLLAEHDFNPDGTLAFPLDFVRDIAWVGRAKWLADGCSQFQCSVRMPDGSPVPTLPQEARS